MAGELIEQLIAASQQPVVLDRLAWIWIELSEGGPIDGRIWRYEQRLPQAVAIATVSVRHSISYVSSSVMAFSNLDLRYATLRGLHFGCTDAERERLRGEKDSGWSAGYVGGNCRADFSESNLTHSDFQRRTAAACRVRRRRRPQRCGLPGIRPHRRGLHARPALGDAVARGVRTTRSLRRLSCVRGRHRNHFECRVVAASCVSCLRTCRFSGSAAKSSRTGWVSERRPFRSSGPALWDRTPFSHSSFAAPLPL